ncbi:universal stress protein UspA [Methylobacterium sp. Leaf123]|uniref:universal stress protein n=1 Tax=Methylobacterium sp. Leaf123 TaxID=1736264 RepID=UPI0006FEFD9E|nr:universal stress protein [Methylobacterium sp. Leaf123]KQQ13533.1 universal stress protein UspA [Methylobacterium sp. Leaf123]
MTISNIMVSLDLAAAAADRVQLAAGLAREFEARLTGVGACQFQGFMPVGDVIEVLHTYEVEERCTRERLDEAKALFRRAAGTEVETAWRSALARPLDHLAEQSRAADLVVVARHSLADGDLGPMGIPVGALLMEAGRPVLVAPPGIKRLEARRAIVAWKNTPEARRALHDALPLLARAETVQVVTIGPGARREGAEDVAMHLAGHGITATARPLAQPDISAADELIRFVQHEGVDLVVMGAYGHSRLREWVFGGLTRDMLQLMPVCCLMSH